MTRVKADETFKTVPMQSDATLRDYFAAKAMQALLSNQVAMKAGSEAAHERGIEVGYFAAVSSYEIADYMLRARDEAK